MDIGKALVILGLVGKEFTDEDLKYAFRVYSRRTHPDLDRNPFSMFGFGMSPELGYVQTTEAVSFHTCRTCKGTGETKMFNPVLRKGMLGR